MYEIMTFLILIQLEILLPSIKANLRREAPNSLFPVSHRKDTRAVNRSMKGVPALEEHGKLSAHRAGIRYEGNSSCH
jgi:hypothetical protein